MNTTNRKKSFLALAFTITACPALVLATGACGGGGADASSATNASPLSGALGITTPLSLSTNVVSAGQAVEATVTYTNATSSPVSIRAVAIAARPPGGTHAGGPYDDFSPYASPTTVAPGGTLTATATRPFTASDPKGAWIVYATYQDDAGAWHDGPDTTLAVGDGQCAPPPDAGGADAGGNGGPPLVVPPVANATPGSWTAGSINGMPYQMLLPSGYDAGQAYPLILYLHQLDNASQIPAQIDPWFNDVGFRTNHPAIVVAPQCDQSADPSGQTINWGGVSSGDQPCQDNAIALVDQVVSAYSVYTPKIYVTGNSMGGIGSWDLIIKYNTKAPKQRPVFAAALILAGATYDWGYPQPDPSVVSALSQVPIWAIHGAQDTQVPLDWDRNMFAAQQAAGGSMQLLVDPNLGHDVWDTYYVAPTAETYWSWLFAQSR